MVISQKKQVSCKHAKIVSHKKKCLSQRICKYRLNGHLSCTGKPSTIPLSHMPPENAETSAERRNTNLEREDMSVDYLLSCPFKKMCSYLTQLDTRRDCALITETILHFSLMIYGLPECRREDLLIAVYLFIEDTFGIKSRIALCVRLPDDGNRSVVGVVFETIRMKYNVLKNNALLEGAEVRLKDNKDLRWIAEAMGTH